MLLFEQGERLKSSHSHRIRGGPRRAAADGMGREGEKGSNVAANIQPYLIKPWIIIPNNGKSHWLFTKAVLAGRCRLLSRPIGDVKGPTMEQKF